MKNAFTLDDTDIEILQKHLQKHLLGVIRRRGKAQFAFLNAYKEDVMPDEQIYTVTSAFNINGSAIRAILEAARKKKK